MPSNISHFNNNVKTRKRWSLACKTVYFIVTLSKTTFYKHKSLLRSPSYVILDVNSNSSSTNENLPKVPSLFSIDQITLTSMLRDKDLESLTRLGGVKHLAVTLETNPTHGVSTYDLKRRQTLFGSNVLQKPPKRKFLMFVIDAMKDIVIIILIICACLSLVFGIKQHGIKEGWYDGGSIIIAITLVVLVSAISNFKQSRQFAKFSYESSNINIEVLRDGHRQHVSIFEIVVGDIVFLKIGDKIPADGLFLDGHSLKVDESSMTGESEHVEVNDDNNPFLFSGTKVTNGYGTMLVTSVGMKTTWGEMMSSISLDTNEETPLQKRLNKLTSYIGKVGLLVALLVLIVMLIRYFTGKTRDEHGNREFNGSQTKSNDIMNSIISIISAAVTIVVVAIPEGLPLAVTLTLAYSMKKMMGENAMVRKLSACETMGSATTICTDKTGTLTLNQMSVTEFYVGKEIIKTPLSLTMNVQELLKQAVGLNTTGSVCKSPFSESTCEVSGSPTEKAILKWGVFDLGLKIDELRDRIEVVKVEAFNSEEKRSGVKFREKNSNKMEVHWKGAAEMILEKCSNYYDFRGEIISMDEEDKKHFREIIRNMAAKSLRCIAFAHKQEDADSVSEELDESGLTFLGIVGLKDPCRPGVESSVKECKKAGVKVKMITGDNIFTAIAIARECGIIEPDDELHEDNAIEGAKFRNYPPHERMSKIEHIRVMARSSPFDKLLMVQCLRKNGHVVVVTGDGTNDGPALKEADIGLSMGIQGTEVAKESSDIVILDDNFASVVTVLRWGRCVYNNIQKFIQFQLTVNVGALVINFVGAISSGNVPLTAVQMLWVNLIMDTLGALALATEEPTDELMKREPVGRTRPLVTKVMWRNLIGQAIFQIAILLTLQFKGQPIFKVKEKVNDTIIFNCFVLCQVFNEFNARELEKKNIFKGVLKNKLFLGIVVITILLQVAMVEFLNKFAGTERLNLGQWSACLVIAALTWPIGWLVKCIPISTT